MLWYKYPAEFDLGENPRVRGLNVQLESMYATVAISYDFLEEAKEDYEYDGTNDYALATLNRAAVTRAQDALDALLPHAEALIAEMRAIGGKYFILPKLEGKISIKDFVPEGSMKHLLEAEHFFQEELADIVDENYKSSCLGRLRLASIKVNRLNFLEQWW